MPLPGVGSIDGDAAIQLVAQSADALQRLELILAELSDNKSEVAKQVIFVAKGYLEKLVPPAERAWGDVPKGLDSVWQLVRAIPAREKEEAHLQQSAVRLTLWVARLEGWVTDQEFVKLAARVFLPSGSDAGAVANSQLSSLVASQLHRTSTRDPLLLVGSLFNAELKDLSEAVHARERSIGENEHEIQQLRKALAGSEDEASKLRAELAQRDSTIEALNQDIGDHRAVKRQTEKQLRAKVAGLLNDQIQPLVRDIYDSASMEPVRVHVILDRTDSLTNIIQKEATWLKSSD